MHVGIVLLSPAWLRRRHLREKDEVPCAYRGIAAIVPAVKIRRQKHRLDSISDRVVVKRVITLVILAFVGSGPFVGIGRRFDWKRLGFPRPAEPLRPGPVRVLHRQQLFEAVFDSAVNRVVREFECFVGQHQATQCGLGRVVVQGTGVPALILRRVHAVGLAAAFFGVKFDRILPSSGE